MFSRRSNSIILLLCLISSAHAKTENANLALGLGIGSIMGLGVGVGLGVGLGSVLGHERNESVFTKEMQSLLYHHSQFLQGLLDDFSPSSEKGGCQNQCECQYPYKRVLNECFYISKKPLKWVDARQYCQGMSGDLASPENLYALKSYLMDMNVKGELWLGATDSTSEGVWNWVDGRPIEGALWHPGQPDNGSGTEDCLTILLEWQPPLNDDQCFNVHNFVCQYRD